MIHCSDNDLSCFCCNTIIHTKVSTMNRIMAPTSVTISIPVVPNGNPVVPCNTGPAQTVSSAELTEVEQFGLKRITATPLETYGSERTQSST